MLVLEKWFSEVWQVFGVVKSEFGKFGDVFVVMKKMLEWVVSNIEQVEVWMCQMNCKFKVVEVLLSDFVQSVLGLEIIVFQDDEIEVE